MDTSRMNNLIITKLEGYSGIRLHNGNPLTLKPGINLLVGRNGCGKTNLINLVQSIATGQGTLDNKVESSFFYSAIRSAVQSNRADVRASFGDVPIVKYSYKQSDEGIISISLKKDYAERLVLDNLVNGSNGASGAIETNVQAVNAKFRSVFSGHNPPKFETSGSFNFSFLPQEHNNVAHEIMQGPIRDVSNFYREKMIAFLESTEFINRVEELEKIVNAKFAAFLGNTSKTIKINCDDIRRSGHVFLSLCDNGNYIESSYISAGESALLNLVFFLGTAKEEGWDVISFDEPEIHMHDDMIQILVNELSTLSEALPNCIMIVASHSTSLIEKIAALGQTNVNIITFDSHRNVANTQEDIQLINALVRNGVSFSPLMLSGRTNIFIENQLKGEGKIHRDFFLRFFPKDNKPNVVPLGNSDNVGQSDIFSDVFEEIIKIENIRAIGIKDGDVWIKCLLVKFMKSEITLSHFIEKLKAQKNSYIKSSNANYLYFNFWEIENLYLMPEMLSCWTKNDLNLDLNTYKGIVVKYRTSLAEEYLKTTIKSLARVRIDRVRSVHEARENIAKVLEGVKAGITDVMQNLANELIDSLVAEGLTNWLPGKELQKILKVEGYQFNADDANFEDLPIAGQFRRILTDNYLAAHE